MTASRPNPSASPEELFDQHFGRTPRWIARAPGRVNLIGEHTDYNDGYVLPMALECDTTILAAPNATRVMRWRTTAMDDIAQMDLSRTLVPAARGHWSNYPCGVAAGFVRAGHAVPGFDALVHSTVPLGGGLSSSAALEVATATLLEAILGVRLDPAAKALLCQSAEAEFAGVPCGIMDQFVSTLGRQGHLLLLDCRSRQIQPIPFADASVAVLIVNTNIRHDLASSEYPIRRAQCELAAQTLGVSSLRDATREQLDAARAPPDPVIFARARHVITEIGRTVRMAECVRNSDWPDAGDLMYQSHESLRNDFEVSCPELDAIVASTRRIGVNGGVYGCRMTGGGFGGCAVALIQAAARREIEHALTEEYLRFSGIAPTVFSSRAGDGTTLIRGGGS